MRVKAVDLSLGVRVDGDYLLASTHTGVTSRGSDFMNGTLSDTSGSIKFVWWDYDKRNYQGVVHVVGEVEQDRRSGNLQVKVLSLSPRHSTSNEEFEKTTAYPVESLWITIVNAAVNIRDLDIKTILFSFLDDHLLAERFKSSPAATGMHHAFRGGLLEHTSQMVELTEAMFQLHFMKERLNKDLCLFGIIMHDFCKIFEYSPTVGYPITVQGVLVPHIPMAGALIYERCNTYGVHPVVRDHLMHVVLAHHGRMDWGSPVNMATPEAAFVHYVDNLHGTIFGWLQHTEGAKTDLVKVKDRTILGSSFNEILTQVRKAGGNEN
jgi:3'-5' exoribonuclease